MTDPLGKLLVVDDVAENRESLRRRFTRLGYEVVEAAGGAQALDLVAREPFDLVLLDILMPEIDGMEVLRRLRAQHGFEALPIIMVTAKAQSNDVVAALQLGANDYLTKPIDMAVAGARVAVQIGRKRAEERSQAARLELEATVEQLRAAMEASEAANRAKSEFLANMSHEIRTPLNGVLGMADMLGRSDLSSRDREFVEIIRASGQTLDRLLSDILDLARVEAGEIRLVDEPLHLGETVRSVAALSRLRADEKGVSVAVEVAPEAEAWFLGDAARIRQILTNLVSNAVKFTTAGEVRITAKARPDGVLTLAVRDTGVGFDPEQKALIFGRFQQADGSITRRFGGSGLGLAISRELAQLMGGTLDCSSEPGVGSTFWAELPLTACAAPDAARTATVSDEALAPVRILIADDHPTNRRVAELILADAGVDLVSVGDGREALQAFVATPFDVVLMDMQMPVMDGVTAVRRIREHERIHGLARTPVLMLTASALPEHIAAAAAAGADGHIAKPISATGLITSINNALQDRAQRDAAAAAA